MKKKYFDDNSYLIYLCVSHPEYETVTPFESFLCNQNKLLELNEKGAKFLYCNAVKILTPEYLAKVNVPHRYQFAR